MKTILKRRIPIDVQIEMSGADIADLFFDMNDIDVVNFFNHLGNNIDWLDSLIQSVSDYDILSYNGKLAMKKIGEYVDTEFYRETQKYFI